MGRRFQARHNPDAMKQTGKPCLCDLCVSGYELAARQDARRWNMLVESATRVEIRPSWEPLSIKLTRNVSSEPMRVTLTKVVDAMLRAHDGLSASTPDVAPLTADASQ
jgi:hypothetical protein